MMKKLMLMIPEPPASAGFTHHPVSRGANPVRYKAANLLDKGEAPGEWVEFFEFCLMGLYWKGGGAPVPYAFKTADDKVRSLDAGCLKFLSNRQPAEVIFSTDRQSIIEAVTPTPALIARWQPRKAEVLDAFAAANKRSL